MAADYRLRRTHPGSSCNHSCWSGCGVFAAEDEHSSGTWYAALALLNVFFAVPVKKKYQKQFVFPRNSQQHKSTLSLQGCINSPIFFHDIVQRDVDHLDMLQSVPFINDRHEGYHCINDIMLIKLDEREVASALEALVRRVSSRSWERNLTENQRLDTSEIARGLVVRGM